MRGLLLHLLRWIWVPLLLGAVALAIWGVSNGQYGEVYRWFNILCYSCIGLGS